MNRSLTRSCLLAALLCSPLAMAVGTGTTHPDDPHSPAPQPGVDSTLNPVERPLPRDTDPRIQGNDPDTPPARQTDGRGLPGSGETGPEGGIQGNGPAGGTRP